jgi:hypothetical protein
MEEKKSRRGYHPNTIKALKDAASNREKTKDRVNVTLNFHTLNLCDRTGNRSRALDEAVRMLEELGLVEQWQQRVINDSHD